MLRMWKNRVCFQQPEKAGLRDRLVLRGRDSSRLGTFLFRSSSGQYHPTAGKGELFQHGRRGGVCVLPGLRDLGDSQVLQSDEKTQYALISRLR